MKSKEVKLLRKRLAAARHLQNPLDVIDSSQLSEWFSKASPQGQQQQQQQQQQLQRDGWVVQFVSSLSSNQLERCLQILQDNMEALYQKSSWGWSLPVKRQELQHEHARFLLLLSNSDNTNNNDIGNADATHCTAVVANNNDNDCSNNNSNIVAFCHFRFDWDDDDNPTEAVVYIYELQIHSQYQRCGIGQALMNHVLPQVCRRAQLDKMMLTVFHHNDAAMQFYQTRCGFLVDASSPSQFGEPADYEILSRRLEKP